MEPLRHKGTENFEFWMLDFGLKQKAMADSRDQRTSRVLIEQLKIKN
jgi:hypothetical protein